jgi:hypothetical protein
MMSDDAESMERLVFREGDERLRRRLKERLLRIYLNDGAVLEHLIALDAAAGALAVLSAIPLVRVAWADHDIDSKEREAILAVAEAGGLCRGSPSARLLEHWLRARPCEDVHAAWREYIGRLCERLGEEEREALATELLRLARRVARAEGGLLGFAGRISKAERAALESLEQAFAAPPRDGGD